MNTTDTMAGRGLEALQAAIAGQVFVPGQVGYDQARTAWNLAADQRPAVVVDAGSAADVVQAVRFARANGMRIAPQGTGHGAGPLEWLHGAMLLRTTRMRKVCIDPAARTARAEAGAVWQDVTVPVGQHSLAALAGSSPDVGVTGYTLGGGLGWLARRYGLAANSVTAAELVTADGDLVRTDAGHEPDLFWAVRGGGGVGVVTALEMRLYPVGELYAGDCSSRSSAPPTCCTPGANGLSRCRTRSPQRAACCGCRGCPSSPNRCAAGPSSWSRPPASVTRTPAPSRLARCVGSARNRTPSRCSLLPRSAS
jgi:FAD binding domain